MCECAVLLWGGCTSKPTEHLLGKGVSTPQDLAPLAGPGGWVLTPTRTPQQHLFSLCNQCVTAAALRVLLRRGGCQTPRPPQRACATRGGGQGVGGLRCTPPPKSNPRRLLRLGSNRSSVTKACSCRRRSKDLTYLARCSGDSFGFGESEGEKHVISFRYRI